MNKNVVAIPRLACSIIFRILVRKLTGELELFSSLNISGLSWGEAKSRCTGTVVTACHNATDSVTVAGTKGDISNFVHILTREGHFAKEVDSAGIAFHSPFMEMPSRQFRTSISDVSILNIKLNVLFCQPLSKRRGAI